MIKEALIKKLEGDIAIAKADLKTFLNKITLPRKKVNKFFDGYIGFFGYELCCELIGIKIPK